MKEKKKPTPREAKYASALEALRQHKPDAPPAAEKSAPPVTPPISAPKIEGESKFAAAMRRSMEQAAGISTPAREEPVTEPVTVEKLQRRLQELEIEKDDQVGTLKKSLDALTTKHADLEKLVSKIAEQPVYGGPAVRRIASQVQAQVEKAHAVSAAENHLATLDEIIARTQNPVAKSELMRQRAFAVAVLG